MEKRHVATAIEALTLAFMEDPLMEFFAPDVEKRKRVSPWFWRSGLSYGMRWGVVETDESGRSAAIWMPPGGTSMPMHRIMRTSFAQAPFRLGLRGFLNFGKMTGVMESIHNRQVPDEHWYLLGLGVHPDLQGQGVGSALMESGHRRADAANMSCYLETSTEEDVRFYSHRGDDGGELISVSTLSGTTMIRRPASERQAAT